MRVAFSTRDATGDVDSVRLSYKNHSDLMKGVNGLTGLAGRLPGSASLSVPGADALYVDIDFVTHDYFRVLGMRMAAGRPLAPDEDRGPGGTPVAILSHRLAKTLFGDPDQALGRSVLVNGLNFTLVGVAPPEFLGLKNDHYPQVWLPAATSARVWHTPHERWDQERGRGILDEFVGQLAPNVALEQARAELTAAARALAVAYPLENQHFQTAEIRMERQSGMSFSGGNTRSEVTFMVTLFALGGALLLLLAGANVGNLLLFRVARRRGEMAVRSALGASRWRLLRAHLIEVSLISLSGGAVGLVAPASHRVCQLPDDSASLRRLSTAVRNQVEDQRRRAAAAR